MDARVVGVRGTQSVVFRNEYGNYVTNDGEIVGFGSQGPVGFQGPVSDGADRQLGNLENVQVNEDIVPGIQGALDIGSPQQPWRRAYFNSAVGTQGGGVRNVSEGSMAFGDGSGEISAVEAGSLAFGSSSGLGIQAAGKGSLALGYDSSGGVHAVADNSWQFGPGSNGEEDTLSVGGGFRLKGTVGPPSSPRLGDLWIDNGFVYVYSNGNAIQIM